MTPYYETPLGKLYHGDCLEIMPELEPVDLVLTDPPYKQEIARIDFRVTTIYFLESIESRQYVFWGGSEKFPLSYTSKHKWVKLNGFGGKGYEEIYERNGGKTNKTFFAPSINSIVSARMAGDTYVKHPTQKPKKLFLSILLNQDSDLTLDPFLGSGTTAIACERLKRSWIGIEIEEKYCEIAAKRIEQERKQRKLF